MAPDHHDPGRVLFVAFVSELLYYKCDSNISSGGEVRYMITNWKDEFVPHILARGEHEYDKTTGLFHMIGLGARTVYSDGKKNL